MPHTETVKEWDADTKTYIPESIIVADPGDVECMCSNIIAQEDAIQCVVCHDWHCKSCAASFVDADWHKTGWAVCIGDECQARAIDMLKDELDLARRKHLFLQNDIRILAQFIEKQKSNPYGFAQVQGYVDGLIKQF